MVQEPTTRTCCAANSLILRRLAPHEVHLCVEGGRLFFKEGEMPGGFEEAHFVDQWKSLITRGIGVIFILMDGDNPAGALGAVIGPHLFSAKKMATECFWFMLPQYRGSGLRLLQAFEEWARDRGAKLLSMIHLVNLQPSLLAALYERRGYRKTEVNYVKEIE